ncbi:3-oxoacyl-[acyl-carrier protein] reductase [Acinetobacter marinus]|uniref:3-oxoacyl-[acyl-carrier protein] reductase n=1 Tax=Acinetobacter marinus TaxID=281375 RepID=A0A1G6GT04_9GAMM|nr:3-oxoacyl-ACP reductase [Acinetobacter marinus]SDB85051.1 3-oxoacyl-[acyl-carrier protein] reductase [Acinetobacter marinus]
MSDQYQTFAKSPIGKFVIKNLGLPSPTALDRFEAGAPVIQGAVLLGAAVNSTLSGAISQVLSNIHADTYAGNNAQLQQAAADVGLNLRAFNSGDKESKFKALVFDASGIENADQLKDLYNFFNPVARQILSSGRVIVIGTTPETAGSVSAAIAQRALEGFVKSVGKEFKKGVAAELVYVDQGAEANLESTLRFLLSPRSAYVSGQVIRVSKADVAKEIDWSKPLAGKTAVVTGASRGIGEAIAHVLARDGAHVICLDIPPQQADLERVAGEIGGSVLALDITAADAGEKIKAAAANKGGLDIIVHNAGVTRDKTLANMKPELWDMVVNINLASNERVNDYLLNNDGLNANGRIVCVSSISGIAGNLGQTNYAVSKAGVIGLVKFTAPTLKNGITINAVAPGFIETQMTAAIPFAIREAGRRMNSMSQGGLPVDVAETIAYFASTASTGLNGNVVRVCGQSLLGA